jgi:hypothetical protein
LTTQKLRKIRKKNCFIIIRKKNFIINLWLEKQKSISFVNWVLIKPSEIVKKANPLKNKVLRTKKILKNFILQINEN